jgi:hypothetical protein
MFVRYKPFTGEPYYGCTSYPQCQGARPCNDPSERRISRQPNLDYDEEYRRYRTTGEELEPPE